MGSSEALCIASEGNAEIYLKGASKAEADAFAAAIREAWTKTNHEILDTQKSRLESVLSRISKLQEPVRYPAACAVTPLLEEARALSKSLSKVRLEAVGKEAVEHIDRVNQFSADPPRLVVDLFRLRRATAFPLSRWHFIHLLRKFERCGRFGQRANHASKVQEVCIPI